MDTVLDFSAGLNFVCTSFHAVKWRDGICPIHNMFPRFASNNAVNFIREVMLFAQLLDLQLGAHFGVVDNLSVPLIIGTSFIDRFVNRMFPIKRHIVAIPSHPMAIIS